MTLPSDDTLKWLISRYAAVLAAAGDAFEGAELVTPTGRHFPDRFERDGESVARLLERMRSYTPLADDIDLSLAFFEPEGEEASGGGCGTCGPTSCATDKKKKAAAPPAGVQRTRDGYRVLVNVQEAGNPVVLTSSLARCLGAMLLAEAEVEGVEDAAADAEIAAAATGFGVLMSAASHLYAKSCGGVNIKRGTTLTLEESSVALALFLAVNDVKPSQARAHLEPSQREALGLAIDLVSCNPKLVSALRNAPETLTDGHFPVARERGLFDRLFGKRDDEPELAPVTVKRAPKSEDELRRIAEAKALVEEALKT